MQINYNDNPRKHPSKADPGSELCLDIKNIQRAVLLHLVGTLELCPTFKYLTVISPVLR